MKNVAESKFVARLTCADCGAQLNETVSMSGDELYREWTLIAISASFASGKCPKGCRATFSDLNINTKLTIYDAETGHKVEFQMFKYLKGSFYSADYTEVCDCPEQLDQDIYRSERYPAVHGGCGRWLSEYQGI